jgi:hypothetical protein
MDEKHSDRCLNCGVELHGDREKEMEFCLECQLYRLLYGCWPMHHDRDPQAPSTQM